MLRRHDFRGDSCLAEHNLLGSHVRPEFTGVYREACHLFQSEQRRWTDLNLGKMIKLFGIIELTTMPTWASKEKKRLNVFVYGGVQNSCALSEKTVPESARNREPPMTTFETNGDFSGIKR